MLATVYKCTVDLFYFLSTFYIVLHFYVFIGQSTVGKVGVTIAVINEMIHFRI
jgi:hypothetical protein